jgi:hypothetical protein
MTALPSWPVSCESRRLGGVCAKTDRQARLCPHAGSFAFGGRDAAAQSGGRDEVVAEQLHEPLLKGSVLDIVYSPPSILRRYRRWFR